MNILIIIFIIIFFLSSIYSGFETGMISLDRFKLEQEAKKSKLKKKILYFYDNNDKTFGTTLIGSNITNVLIAAIATYIFAQELPLFDTRYTTLIIAFLVLVFCEILPKNLFRDFPNRLVDFFFPLINTTYILLKPLVKIVSYINKQIQKLYKINKESSYLAFTKDDLAFIVSQTYNDGNIHQPQKEMLEDALEFNELVAKNVMKPRTEIVAIPDTMTYSEMMAYAKKEGYTRYPVYHETLDEITGVLIIYDLLETKNKKRTAKEVQREIFFAPESMDLNVLLKELQTMKKTMAIIVDAYGGTSGMLTIEDILEEIVGEIDDEYDIEEINDVVKINDNTWIVNGYVDVDTLIDDFEINLPEGDYETIAGMIIDQLARIPSKGQKINVNDFVIEILEATNTKIKKVKIIRNVIKIDNGK